ncbi:MAG: hypothetical protein R3362_01370 [Rhodothermales bacterium]|nr:hypothetical protein [Rhodothermales bacterium]
MPTVELHIDRLVLRGFGRLDGAAVGATAEAELTRLLAERGVPPALQLEARVTRLDGGHFYAAPNASAEAVGRDIAHAVYGGLAR